MKYPLTHTNWNNKEISAMKKVISSGMFTMGKNVLRFENNFSKYISKKYSVMVNSGSSANLLALSSLFYKKKNHKEEMRFWSLEFRGVLLMHHFNN